MRSREAISLLALLLFCGQHCAAQEQTEGGSSFRMNAGLIINRSYSNITEKVEVIDDLTRITRTRSDSAPAIKAGFFIGGEALLGKKERFQGAFALNFVKSSAAYHSSFTEEGRTTQPGFTHMKRATELELRENYFYLDIHAGARNRIHDNMFLTTGLVLGKPLVTNTESSGYVLTTYSTSGSPETESFVAYLPQDKKKVKGAANISFRLRIEYQFGIGDSKGSVFVFRNFGLIYTLPLWGFGFSYTL